MSTFEIFQELTEEKSDDSRRKLVFLKSAPIQTQLVDSMHILFPSVMSVMKLNSFVHRFQCLVSSCELGSFLDDPFRDQVITGCHSEAIMRVLLNGRNIALYGVLNIARDMEASVVWKKEKTPERQGSTVFQAYDISLGNDSILNLNAIGMVKDINLVVLMTVQL